MILNWKLHIEERKNYILFLKLEESRGARQHIVGEVQFHG